MAKLQTRSFVAIVAILLTQYSAAAILSNSSSFYDYDGGGFSSCQPNNLTIDYCRAVIGNETSMPNSMNHTSQYAASLSLSEFQPFLQIECSPHLKTFLCLTHFPICTSGISIPPCRDMCNQVEEDCQEAFLKLGSKWPDSLNCQKFAADVDGFTPCASLIPPRTTSESQTPDQPSSHTSNEDKPDPYQRCQPKIDLPICKDTPYNDVIYPNLLGHRNQSEALADISKYTAFVTFEDGPCANSLKTFLCVAYQPPCKIIKDVAVPIPPCQAVCERALSDSCLALIASFNMELPAVLTKCSKYPRQISDYTSCFASEAEFDPAVEWEVPISKYIIDECEQTGCVPVTNLMCSRYFAYTIFPNLLGHKTMQEANEELDRLIPVIESGCSDELPPFTCVATFVSSDDPGRLPCQSACNRIWKNCRRVILSTLGKRPRLLTCRLYPIKDCDSELTAPTQAVDIINSERVNATRALIKYKNIYPYVLYTAFANGPWSWPLPDSGVSSQPNRDPEAVHQLVINMEYMEGYHVTIEPMSDYGRSEGVSTVVWIPGFPMNVSIPGMCDDPVEIPVCRKLGYMFSSYPNWHNWDTEGATREWREFFPGEEEPEIPASGCMLDILHLLCSYVAPKCTETSTIDPCREFCDKVHRECNDTLENMSVSIPYCDRLNRKDERPCISTDVNDVRVTELSGKNTTYCTVREDAPPTVRPEFFDPSGNLIPVTSSNSSPSNLEVQILSPRMTSLHLKEITEATAGTYSCKASGGSESQSFNITIPKTYINCEPIQHTLCKGINEGSDEVQLPNLLKHYVPGQPELSSYQFLPLLFTNCSSDLLKLVCALYATRCPQDEYGNRLSPEDLPPLPCSEYCENVKDTCAKAAARIGFEWPEEARCDLLEPAQNSHSQEEACVSARIGVERTKDGIKLRRYDITDQGMKYLFYGWSDVQGQHAANDYCRVVSIGPHKMLSCALAGTHGESQYNYNTSNPDTWLDLGHTDTWYMKDVNGDGRDDYCRCIGYPPDTRTSCLIAGLTGFEADEFQPEDGMSDCQYIKVNRVFGP